MNADKLIAMLNLSATEEQRRAMRYLERIGQSFCVHFGTDNAVSIARAHWNKLRRYRYLTRNRAR